MTGASPFVAIDVRYVSGHMSGMTRYALSLLHGLTGASAEGLLKGRYEPAPGLPIRTRDGFEFQLMNHR
jgi:hypothetical protein